MVEGTVKRILQLEGSALLVAAVVAYHWLGWSWWWFAGLLLLPDVSFLGYLLGPRIGAISYNVAHSTVGPFFIAAYEWLGPPHNGTSVLTTIALVWFAHIGMDRAIGYGLKYTSGFKDTHLGKL